MKFKEAIASLKKDMIYPIYLLKGNDHFLQNFFIERYKDAYQIQLDQFIKSIRNKKNTLVTFEDGKNALILANSATKSVKLNKVVKPKF